MTLNYKVELLRCFETFKSVLNGFLSWGHYGYGDVRLSVHL